jgi:KDO2-lipid IV(A) lauroyltransferase
MADISIEEQYPQKDMTAAAAYLNQYIEMVIMRAPEQWMWLHKRFKSLPDGTSHTRYQ